MLVWKSGRHCLWEFSAYPWRVQLGTLGITDHRLGIMKGEQL